MGPTKHIIELLARAELGHGQRRQHIVDLDRLCRVAFAGRLAAGEVEYVTVLGQVRGDGGSCGDCPFEGSHAAGALMSSGTRVQDDDGATSGRRIFVAHHQFGPMRCGRPVDTAQVVAVVVATDRDVVLAVQGDEVGDGAFSAHIVGAGTPTACLLYTSP